MLRPYIISATLIGLLSFVLGSYIIPPANKTRLEFEDQYVQKKKSEIARNVQLEVEQGVIVYIERYEEKRNRGVHFSMEKFDGKKLVSRMTATSVQWDSAYNWTVRNYLIRDFDGLYETISQGTSLDTIIPVEPYEFFITTQQAQEMNNIELRNYINKQKERGVGNVQAFQDEYYKRYSMPFSALILMLIGVSLSSRKVRGGMGIHIGIGIALSALYILFTTFSSTFAIKGTMPILLAVWLPNILFFAVGLILYLKAPK